MFAAQIDQSAGQVEGSFADAARFSHQVIGQHLAPRALGIGIGGARLGSRFKRGKEGRQAFGHAHQIIDIVLQAHRRAVERVQRLGHLGVHGMPLPPRPRVTVQQIVLCQNKQTGSVARDLADCQLHGVDAFALPFQQLEGDFVHDHQPESQRHAPQHQAADFQAGLT